MCCFDKTGTLTSDQFKVVGLAGIPASHKKTKNSSPNKKNHVNRKSGKNDKEDENLKKNEKEEKEEEDKNFDYPVIKPEEFPLPGEFVLSGCHSLVKFEKTIVGDPLEKAALAVCLMKFLKKF